MSGTEDDVVKTITRTITKGKARQGKARQVGLQEKIW